MGDVTCIHTGTENDEWGQRIGKNKGKEIEKQVGKNIREGKRSRKIVKKQGKIAKNMKKMQVLSTEENRKETIGKQSWRK